MWVGEYRVRLGRNAYQYKTREYERNKNNNNPYSEKLGCCKSQMTTKVRDGDKSPISCSFVRFSLQKKYLESFILQRQYSRLLYG